MSKMTPKKFWQTAAQWGSAVTGGDPGACMYGFDEKGLVQSEKHRADCIAWIEKQCREAAVENGKAGDDLAAQNAELDAMLDYLKTAPVEGAMPELDDFTRAYVTAALWSSTNYVDADEDDDEAMDAPFDDDYGIEHLSPEAVERVKADCDRFRELYGHLLTADNLRRPGGSSVEEKAGHDFWLTRAGHGVGFWDGGWAKEPGEILTRAAKSFGEMELCVGDDGRIHFEGGRSDPAPIEGAAEPAPGMRP